MRLPIFDRNDSRVSHDFSNGPSTRGSHRLSSFAECGRRWAFREVFGLTPRRTRSYFTEGSALHLLLAYHYGIRLHQLGVAQPWLQVPCEIRLDEIVRGDARIRDLALRAYGAFVTRMADDPYTPVAVEAEYWASAGEIAQALGEPAPAVGVTEEASARIDLTVRWEGRVWFVDTKFLQDRGGFKPLDPRFDDYIRSWQFMLQTALGLVAYGPAFGGVIVQRIGKSEGHPIARETIPFHHALMRAFPGVLGELLARERAFAEKVRVNVEAAEQRGDDSFDALPPPSPWACADCDYWALCTAPDASTRRRAAHAYFTTEQERADALVPY